MKKVLLFGLALLLLGSGLFADDAKVMPFRVGRFYLAPSFVYGTQTFDKDGSREDSGIYDSLSIFNLGAALEFGAWKWVTAAVQWAPGINVWSKVDSDLLKDSVGSDSDINLFGVADLFVGAKMQILGTEAPVQTDNFRLAFAPGVKIPLPGPDYKEQDKNVTNDDPMTVFNLDKHVLGVGLRTYFDYIINENFFINLYNEFIYYPVKGDVKKAGYPAYALADNIDKIIGMLPPGVISYSDDVDYGYDLTFELEPVFTTNLAEGIQFSAGLPINYKTTPGTKYDFSYNEAALSGALGPAADPLIAQLKSMEAEGEQTHSLSLRPNVSFFFTSWFLPMEFKLAYFAPLWGMNTRADHTVSFQIRLYFKI